MVPTIRTRPSIPLSQSLPSGSFHRPSPYPSPSERRRPYPSPSEGRQTENHHHRKLTNLITWTTALSNSVKLRAMPCRATRDGWVTVESSGKMWSTGEGNGKPLQYSCLEKPMNSMNMQKHRTLKGELPRSVLHFPGGSYGETSAYNAGGPGPIPGLGKSPGEGNGNPLQNSCLENPMDGGTR